MPEPRFPSYSVESRDFAQALTALIETTIERALDRKVAAAPPAIYTLSQTAGDPAHVDDRGPRHDRARSAGGYRVGDRWRIGRAAIDRMLVGHAPPRIEAPDGTTLSTFVETLAAMQDAVHALQVRIDAMVQTLPRE